MLEVTFIDGDKTRYRMLETHLAVFVDGVDLDTAEVVATDLGLTVDAASAWLGVQSLLAPAP
jgi:hypothetical protein